LKKKSLKSFLKLFFCIFLCLGVGFLGSFFMKGSLDSWYTTLHKPSFTPPNYLFGPVWTILYITIGISFWIILSKQTEMKNHLPYKIFALQLFLNSIWTFLFFYIKSPLTALVDISFLLVAIFFNIAIFAKYSFTAAILLVPYFFWVAFASILNFLIWKMN
jgi:translocator protein